MGIFEPFRALGYITDGTPFSVQRRGLETFVTVSVGKSWQIFNVRAPFDSRAMGSRKCVVLLSRVSDSNG